MTVLRRLDNMAVDVDRREIGRLLGYPGGTLPERVRDLVADAERSVSKLVHPIGVFRMLEPSDYERSPYLHRAGGVVMCLVSIGDSLEREVETRRTQGDLAPALILDTYGSAAVEAVADVAETTIREAMRGEGARCSRRFSPGYGGWDVAEQRWILDALRGSEIGVTLTSGCMMRPRKSVTFGMTVGADPIELREDDICATCGAVDCPWRDTPDRCPGRPNR